MSKRVLMVSWLFPPHSSIGAKRAWRFARHLPAYGWVPTVLCRRSPPHFALDTSDWSLPPEVRVERAYDAAVFGQLTAALDSLRRRFGHSRSGRSVPTALPGLRRPLTARAEERWGRFVDAMLPTETVAVHALHAYSVMNRIAPGHRVIWTTSYPYHSHLLGLRIARAHGLPFVADLRDPWTPNWVHQAKYPHTRRIEAALERMVFEGADAVALTTESLAERYRELFPAWAAKFVALHNAFDSSPVAPTEPSRDHGALSLLHFGNVYGPRSLATVFRALGALGREGVAGLSRVTVENYGKLSDSDRAIAVAEGIENLVRVLDPLPFTSGLARLRGADLLLLEGWNTPDARLSLPGKLYDYMLAGRPVLAESDSPELGEIVRRTGIGEVIPAGDLSAMKSVLARVIAGRGVAFAPDATALGYFSAHECSGRLASLLDRVSEAR